MSRIATFVGNNPNNQPNRSRSHSSVSLFLTEQNVATLTRGEALYLNPDVAVGLTLKSYIQFHQDGFLWVHGPCPEHGAVGPELGRFENYDAFNAAMTTNTVVAGNHNQFVFEPVAIVQPFVEQQQQQQQQQQEQEEQEQLSFAARVAALDDEEESNTMISRKDARNKIKADLAVYPINGTVSGALALTGFFGLRLDDPTKRKVTVCASVSAEKDEVVFSKTTDRRMGDLFKRMASRYMALTFPHMGAHETSKKAKEAFFWRLATWLFEVYKSSDKKYEPVSALFVDVNKWPTLLLNIHTSKQNNTHTHSANTATTSLFGGGLSSASLMVAPGGGGGEEGHGESNMRAV